jgi:hypothetical protein
MGVVRPPQTGRPPPWPKWGWLRATLFFYKFFQIFFYFLIDF